MFDDEEDGGIPDDLYLPPEPDDEDDDSALDALDDLGDDPDVTDNEDASGLDGLHAAPAATADDDHDNLAAIDDQVDDGSSEDDEPDIPMLDATSPSGMVTVSVGLSGLTQRISLTPDSVRISEQDLASDIAAVADVATKQATSAMHAIMVEVLATQGVDRAFAEDFVTTNIPSFATPAEARAAEAALAERDDHHEE